MKALRNKPIFNVYYRYKNINLWKNISINKLTKKKWNVLQSSFNTIQKQHYSQSRYPNTKGIYICHYRKLNIERLYFYKFLNKQILRKYLVNYNEFNFKHYLFKNYLNLEQRLDFNLYKANFVANLFVARFFITKGCIFVNKKRITSINYLLHTNDLIEIDATVLKFLQFHSNFNTIKNKYYIRNLEIDYKTCSFIFLNNSNYYILNFNNFIKKIYYRKYNHTYTLVTTSYKQRLYNVKNRYYINNYFKYFEYIYHYYLFFDKQNHLLNRYKLKTFEDFNINLLLKFIKLHYNDYYFRNILLKRTFNMKYNYLTFLQTNGIFNNYYTFENISNTFNKNLGLIESTYTQNLLLQDFFKYYFNLLFKFYIYLLKNYYINLFQLTVNPLFSINNYNYILLFNQKIFKLLSIKIKLFHYYKNIYLSNFVLKFKPNKYKILDFTKISQIKSSKTKYLTKAHYIKLLYYISSSRYKYYIYRKCTSFKQNAFKRAKIIFRSNKAFSYKYYNCLKIGNNIRVYTKRNYYNRLISKTLLSTTFSKDLKIKKIKGINFDIISKQIYLQSNFNFEITKKKLEQMIKILIIKTDTLNNLTTSITDDNIKATLLFLIKQLTLKLNFVINTRTKKYYYYNYKNLFLLSHLIACYKHNKITFNLTHSQFNILYKNHIRGFYLKQKYQINLTSKNYKRYILSHLESKFNYFYTLYNKPKLNLATNIKKYFLPINFSIKLRKFMFLIRRKNKNFYTNIKYLQRLNKKKDMKKINTFYFCNMNIISSTLNFQDNLFFIDLILNLYIRKINIVYNKFTSKSILIEHSLNHKLQIYLTVPQNKILKKISYFKIYNYNIYKFHYLKIAPKNNLNTTINVLQYFNYFANKYINKNNYYSNYNRYFNLLSNKFNKLYFQYYNINRFKIQKRLFLKLNKKFYINNLYKIYLYYNFNIRKYKLIKYIFMNYLFKEYNILIDNLLTNVSVKTIDKSYIKQLYYNILFTKFFNFDKFNLILQNNFNYPHNLKIIINYFILIKRFYK